MAADPHSEETPDILARRTEKMWRHEDRELTGSHMLWNSAVAIQASLVAATGVFVGNEWFPAAKVLFPYVFFVALAAMIGIVILVVLLRRYDRVYADHFLAIHEGKNHFPAGFNKEQSDKNCRDATADYKKWRDRIERTEILLFVINATIFFCVISIRQ